MSDEDILSQIPNIAYSFPVDGDCTESIIYRGHIDCWIDGKKVRLSQEDQDKLMDYREAHGDLSDEILDEVLEKYRAKP